MTCSKTTNHPQDPEAAAGPGEAGGGGEDPQGEEEVPARVEAPARPEARARRGRQVQLARGARRQGAGLPPGLIPDPWIELTLTPRS